MSELALPHFQTQSTFVTMRSLHLVLCAQLIPTSSCRPYPFRPFGVKRSEPGDALFEMVDGKPVFQSWHVNAFHQQKIGARNQGLPTGTNPYEKIPRWGPPPPSNVQKAERRLRTSHAARHPGMSDLVYNNSVIAALYWGFIQFALFYCLIPVIFGKIFVWVFGVAIFNSPGSRFWKFLQQGSSIANEALAKDVVMAAFEFADTCWSIMCSVGLGLVFYGVAYVSFMVTEYFANHWRLGMERSKNVETRIADARRWSGEMSS